MKRPAVKRAIKILSAVDGFLRFGGALVPDEFDWAVEAVTSATSFAVKQLKVNDGFTRADADNLRQVVLNVLENAFQTENVHVSLYTQDARTVADGIAMSVYTITRLVVPAVPGVGVGGAPTRVG